jgi:plastocyanin
MRLLTALLFFALCATAQAENFAVQARNDNTFTPDELTVKPGDSVTFSNAGGFHNVVWVEGTFDDGSQASPPDPALTWPSDPVRTFSDEGTFAYYCEQHGTQQGAGMAGKVMVSTNPVVDESPPVVTELRAGVNRRRPFATFTISEAATVTAELIRRKTGKTLARRERTLAAGAARVSFGRRDLKPERYAVAVTASDAAGNVAAEQRARFRVR